jgi:hypothetical protein
VSKDIRVVMSGSGNGSGGGGGSSLKDSKNTTGTLHRTRIVMERNLARMDTAMRQLSQDGELIKDSLDEHAVELKGALQSTKTNLNTVKNAEVWERYSLRAALGFFFTVVFYIICKRTRILSLSLFALNHFFFKSPGSFPPLPNMADLAVNPTQFDTHDDVYVQSELSNVVDSSDMKSLENTTSHEDTSEIKQGTNSGDDYDDIVEPDMNLQNQEEFEVILDMEGNGVVGVDVNDVNDVNVNVGVNAEVDLESESEDEEVTAVKSTSEKLEEVDGNVASSADATPLVFEDLKVEHVQKGVDSADLAGTVGEIELDITGDAVVDADHTPTDDISDGEIVTGQHMEGTGEL